MVQQAGAPLEVAAVHGGVEGLAGQPRGISPVVVALLLRVQLPDSPVRAQGYVCDPRPLRAANIWHAFTVWEQQQQQQQQQLEPWSVKGGQV